MTTSIKEIRDLLARCADEGVRLAESQGELHVHFDAAEPDNELLFLLRRHKHDLLQVLLSHHHNGTISVLSAVERQRVAVTAAQRRMWLMDRLEQSVSPYNMVGAYTITGALDCAAMELALDGAIARHEALRSRYIDLDGELCQLVEAPFHVTWGAQDLSSMSKAEQEQSVRDLLHRENTWRFDLQASPLVRATRLKLSPRQWVIAITLHHIACDGHSLEVLKRDIARGYAAAREGVESRHAPPRIQYADYAAWLQRRNQDEAQNGRLEISASRLKDAPRLHGLPLDKPRPPLQGYKGEKVRRAIGAEQLSAVKAQCAEHGVTLFVYLQAIFAAILCIYGYERDVVTGFPVAGRQHRELDDTVGLFVNTLVLRNRMESNPCFVEWLEKVARNVLEALRDQDIPYERLVETLRVERSRAYNPLMQILFVLQSQVETDFVLPGLVTEAIYNAHEPVKFDLQLVAEERSGELELDWHYNADLFFADSIARMADSFMRFLDAVLKDPNRRLYAIPLASKIAPEVSVTETIYPRLEQCFEAFAQTQPDRLAVACGEIELSYGELDRQANALAAILQDAGVACGAVVGLCVERSEHLIVGMLGILKAGAAYVPLDPSLPQQRLETILEDCAAPLLLTQCKLAQNFAYSQRPVLQLDALPRLGRPATRKVTEGADELAYVIYTSGTTGTPKGVTVAHAGVINMLRYFQALAPLSPPWNGSQWSSISFDASVYEIFSALCFGGSLHIVPDALRLDADALFHWMDRHAIHSAYMYAGYLEPFGRYLHREHGCPEFKRLMVGVEPIAIDHLHAIAQRLPDLQILNAYGPTETSVCCTIHAYIDACYAGNGRAPIGRAVPGMQLFVMNAEGEPAPEGAIGELCVGGIGLARDYLGNPELTAARFVIRTIDGLARRLYRTGDLVRYRPDGELEFIGRADEQIKLRGFRIEPGEIEVRLCQQPEISDAVVLLQEQGADKHLVAYVVLKAGHVVEEAHSFSARIKRALREFLPDYMIPSEILVLDSIPLTTNGKVNRAALPASSVASGGERVVPRNDIERRLVKIWQDILELETVGVTDDFFALGGQSLLATRLLGSVRSEFDLPDEALSLGDLFEKTDIATFAEVVLAAINEEQARQKEQLLAMQDATDEGTF